MENIKRRGHLTGSLPIHPYFGKVDPALVSTLIEAHSKKGDLLLDPFCGSGTVLHEGIINDRNVVGWDSSPLAVLISTAKLLGINESEEREIVQLERAFDNLIPSNSLFDKELPIVGDIPEMPRVRDIPKWFNENALKELRFIKWFLEQNHSSLSTVAQVLTKLAFSRIITRASNQQSESNYRSITKPDVPGRVLALFTDSLRDIVKYTKAFSISIAKSDSEISISRELIINEHFNLIDYSSSLRVSVQHRDASKLHNGPTLGTGAKLVITSPPYLMSWDYGLYHKFRFYWLGFNLNEYEDTEIGRHLRRKNDDIEKYTNDMTGVFEQLSLHIDESGTIAMVNAPSAVYGELVNTNDILVEAARLNGWKLKEKSTPIDIPGPHHGMYASQAARGTDVPGEAGKREHVLIFKRH